MSNGVSWFREPAVNTRRSIMVDQQTNALLLYLDDTWALADGNFREDRYDFFGVSLIDGSSLVSRYF